jgi:hypothetical protein
MAVGVPLRNAAAVPDHSANAFGLVNRRFARLP